ncbi:Short chain dehydrogenase sol3 [Lachnellula suecica]|uniref:Short chain dehydrogenase sol3 n=1 Tax=Lachnellula suecica TaxID=602035 RepID=A0A8T9C7G8_9HELO|nr:Short chain dehydrogenase sol3 [Lachnellula suecica]
MSEEFLIEPKIWPFLRLFLHSQLFRTPQSPTQSFADQTVIVTGANVGLGLEAARHFYRLNCAKLILAVRTVSKGQSAKEDILQSVKHRTEADAIEVWNLDLTSSESTVSFAGRVEKELPRVDMLVESAGIHNKNRAVSEGTEQTMQVNVINTFLLALLILPKRAETAKFAKSLPHLTIINAPDIYESLDDEKDYNGQSSYEISKLIQILFVRELVSRTIARTSPSPPVTINLVNPGLCISALSTRNEKPFSTRFIESIIYKIIGRTTEVGSQTLVLGASAGPTSHGEYMSDGRNQDVESWIYTDVGKEVQKKVFEQTVKMLELRQPGIGHSVGL